MLSAISKSAVGLVTKSSSITSASSSALAGLLPAAGGSSSLAAGIIGTASFSSTSAASLRFHQQSSNQTLASSPVSNGTSIISSAINTSSWSSLTSPSILSSSSAIAEFSSAARQGGGGGRREGGRGWERDDEPLHSVFPVAGLQDFRRSFETKVVSVKRVGYVTKAGRMSQFQAIVVAGNGAGVGGFGMGKGPDVGKAVMKATADARKNLMYVKACRGTLWHDINTKFLQTRIILRAAPPGTGIRANSLVYTVGRLLGFKDMVGKVLGSTNPHNVLRATFKALGSMQSAEHVAARRGKAVQELMTKK